MGVSKENTIHRLCAALTRLHDVTQSAWDEPCDCLCEPNPHVRFQSSGEALEMLESMVAAYTGVVAMAVAIKSRCR